LEGDSEAPMGKYYRGKSVGLYEKKNTDLIIREMRDGARARV